MVTIMDGRASAVGPCCEEVELELVVELASRVIASGEMAAADHRRVQAMAPIDSRPESGAVIKRSQPPEALCPSTK